jgi:hypothetical protein
MESVMRIGAQVPLVAIGLLCYIQIAFAADDWEYWSQYELVTSIAKNLDFRVKPELRYNNDFNDLYYVHFEMGVDWKLNQWLVLGPYYRHVNEKKPGDWTLEFRPHLNATLTWSYLGIDLSDRNRLEYRGKEDTQSFRYRNKLTMKIPKYTRLGIQSYIAEEPFYDFGENKWNKNRLYVGLELPIVKTLKGGAFFIYESRLKNDEWTSASILGTSLSYRF